MKRRIICGVMAGVIAIAPLSVVNSMPMISSKQPLVTKTETISVVSVKDKSYVDLKFKIFFAEVEEAKQETIRAKELERKAIKAEAERKRIEAEQKRIAADKERIWAVTYDEDNLSVPSKLTAEELKVLLAGTRMEQLASHIIDAEKKYGINAFFLTGLIANESTWATSPRATNGSNNLTGHAVYNSSSRGSTFDSKRDCIMETATLIANNYLKEKGKHYNGRRIWDVNKQYCQDGNEPDYIWSRTINSISYKLLREYHNTH